MTYGAIHLELVGDLSTHSFIMALQIFTPRRGIPRHIWNGQNFLGSNRELELSLTELD